MTRPDFKILFTALGFLAVVVKGEYIKKDGAKNATALADLIEAFCQTAHSDLFIDKTAKDTAELDLMIEELKEGELHIGKLAELAADKVLLRRIYDRLLQRHRIYATDKMIADEIAHFLEEEINHAVEANMMIVQVQGEEDLFAPCERMATAIVEILKTNGECHHTDLEFKGFSPDEIKRHWRMAYGLAKVELNWMDA
jgi:hypothetical protein